MKSKPIAPSELIINSDGSVFHLHLLPEDIAPTVLLFGDPGRTDMAAQFLDSVELRKSAREFNTVTGLFRGKRVTLLSTGIGTDNIDIVVTELDALANIDFKTRTLKPRHRSLNILRIGTCGACRADIPLGSYVFSRYAIGFDGLMNWYAEGEKHMLADFEEAFVRHMNWPSRLARPYFVKSGERLAKLFEGFARMGMTVSAPGFYGPQGRSVRMDLVMPDLVERLESFEYKGEQVTNIEMESSALFGMSAILGHEAGTLCLVAANRHRKESNPDYKPLMEQLILKALEKIQIDGLQR